MYKEIYKSKIREILNNYKGNYAEYLKERYKKCKHICIFGCGNMGRNMPEMLKEYGLIVDCYCDNDKSKVGMDVHGYGIPCISLDDLIKIKDETAVIVPTRYYKEIYKQLKDLNFPIVDRLFHVRFTMENYLKNINRKEVAEHICKTIDILDDEESCRVITRLVEEWTRNDYTYGQIDDIYTIPQYFPKDIIKNNTEEVFVDCGAYNGDNIHDFLEFENYKFKKYYGFELNQKNYLELNAHIQKEWSNLKDKFITENKGVSDFSGTIQYADRCEGSKISEAGNATGETVTLDDYFGNNKVTFIKMDIEGAEMPALQGGKELISNNYPVLAICIYHKPDDFWVIPQYIKKNWNNYKLYVRHHTDLMTETVLYAVKGDN